MSEYEENNVDNTENTIEEDVKPKDTTPDVQGQLSAMHQQLTSLNLINQQLQTDLVKADGDKRILYDELQRLEQGLRQQKTQENRFQVEDRDNLTTSDRKNWEKAEQTISRLQADIETLKAHNNAILAEFQRSVQSTQVGNNQSFANSLATAIPDLSKYFRRNNDGWDATPDFLQWLGNTARYDTLASAFSGGSIASIKRIIDMYEQEKQPMGNINMKDRYITPQGRQGGVSHDSKKMLTEDAVNQYVDLANRYTKGKATDKDVTKMEDKLKELRIR